MSGNLRIVPERTDQAVLNWSGDMGRMAKGMIKAIPGLKTEAERLTGKPTKG